VKRSATIGGAIWIGLAVLAWLNRAELDWIELLFVFAPLVIVPLGLELSGRFGSGAVPGVERAARAVHFPAAVLAVACFFWPRGVASAGMATVWAGFCLVMAVAGCVRLARGAYRRLDEACVSVALLYPAVGGAWLMASRLGLTPLGFQEPIVLLTAVHFHYAGFAAPVLAGCAARALRTGSGVIRWRLFQMVAGAVLAGPAILAAGFVVGPRLKLAAALVLAASEIGLAILFLLALRGLRGAGAKAFLAIASGAVIFSMVMAGLWAIGEYPLEPFVHLQNMARLHGTANAFGFTLCGLLGFLLGGNGGVAAGERSERI
jgi:YndJ-like protein